MLVKRLIGLLMLIGVPMMALSIDKEFTVQVIAPDTQERSYALEELVTHLLAQRVVFVGESHDRYDHHLAQLAVIQALHQAQPRRWVIGMEFFQQPFQAELDAYIADRLDEPELLRRSEYFQRWGYDYRLYRPIFRYAREQGIPLIALNVSTELVEAVSRKGLDGLDEDERAQLPDEIPPLDAGHSELLRSVYEQHPGTGGFERFVDVQRLWDTGMAGRAADYLREHPEQAMVVLAGSGHIAPQGSIPERLEQQLGIAGVVLLPEESDLGIGRDAAYRLLVTEAPSLPPAGRMGIYLDFSNGVSAGAIQPDSAAERAGVQSLDHILAIDDRPVDTLTDLRLALLDRTPGERVTLTVRSPDDAAERSLELVLD